MDPDEFERYLLLVIPPLPNFGHRGDVLSVIPFLHNTPELI